MTTAAAGTTSRKDVARAVSGNGSDAGLRQRVQAEFLEMPGLTLTQSQAARIFGIDTRGSKRLLEDFVAEGFLARDARGVFRLRTGSNESVDEANCDHPAATSPAPPLEDLLEAVGIEFPCLACGGSYRVPLRKIRASQQMMDSGCQVRHFADCPPGAFAHLIEPAVLVRFEAAVREIVAAAAGAGGRLVGPEGER